MGEDHEVDVLIVGAGPVGLFAAYYSGFRGLSVALVDSLPELGGQITAMYPEKDILDVAGFPVVKGKDLVDGPGRAGRHGGPDVPPRTHRADPRVRPRRVGARRARRRDHGPGQGCDHHRGHRQVHAAPAARRGRVVGQRGGVLRAVVRGVRRQGRRHRGRRGQRVRLGAGAGAVAASVTLSTGETRSAPTRPPSTRCWRAASR